MARACPYSDPELRLSMVVLMFIAILKWACHMRALQLNPSRPRIELLRHETRASRRRRLDIVSLAQSGSETSRGF